LQSNWDMIEKLKAIEERFEEVNQLLSNVEIMSNPQEMKKLGKELKDLSKIVEVGKKYKTALKNLESSKLILAQETDEEFRDLAKEEIHELETQIPILENELKQLLIPKDPEDSMDCILEIRAGTGGDEACLFASDLFRMYQRYCEQKRWKFEVSSLTEGSAGGIKEVIVFVEGEDAFGNLKYESGVHRVQRVPETEANGRIHTSAATVAVLPAPEEFEVELNMNDIHKETFCSSGNGGQSVNTTYSAVRLTHIPTGIVVSMQDERSQIKNYEKALKILKARIYEMEMNKRLEATSALRRSLVSTGDRSAKIRTYNFPQSRVTDHRIGLTLYNLPSILDGNIQEIIDALRIAENTEKLAEGIKNLE